MYGELIMDAVPDKVSENLTLLQESPYVLKGEVSLFKLNLII